MWFAVTGSSMNNPTPERTVTADIVRRTLARRYASERRFRRLGLAAVITGLAFLGLLLTSIVGNGYGAFTQTLIKLDVPLDAAVIDPQGGRDLAAMARADYAGLTKRALIERFPTVSKRDEKRKLYALISNGAAYAVRDRVLAEPERIGGVLSIWVVADDDVDMLVKGQIDRTLPEPARRINDLQLTWVDALHADGAIKRVFNTGFLTSGDSREPELAGIRGALIGSLLTLAVTLALSFPVGIATAIYLEEFAPRNRWTDVIEVNIILQGFFEDSLRIPDSRFIPDSGS